MMAIKQEVAVGRSYIVESGSKVTYVILLDRFWNHFGVSGQVLMLLGSYLSVNFNVFSITTWSLSHFLSDMESLGVLFLAHCYFHYIWHHWDRFFVKITRISTPLAAVRNWYSGNLLNLAKTEKILIVLHGKEVVHFAFFHLRKTAKIGPILSMKDAETCLCLPL